ncbi:GFA family protein [Rhizobium tropici]|uniref:GFA family protein n=2 Tax=Rhizobium tropici TaxID=398 RepID=A0A5B0WAA1_RHITR|nr:GFA family protein [Rhizobium tropici]
MCKRATGGAFAILVQPPLAAFKWTKGKARSFSSSPIAIRAFCPDCGTPLFLQYDDDELIRVTVGSLDHPNQVVPRTHYGVESRLDWAEIGSDLPPEETRERF